VSPAFALILKELRSTDAKFLNGLYENSIGVLSMKRPSDLQLNVYRSLRAFCRVQGVINHLPNLISSSKVDTIGTSVGGMTFN
jgi:hypothetical protein